MAKLIVVFGLLFLALSAACSTDPQIEPTLPAPTLTADQEVANILAEADRRNGIEPIDVTEARLAAIEERLRIIEQQLGAQGFSGLASVEGRLQILEDAVGTGRFGMSASSLERRLSAIELQLGR